MPARILLVDDTPVSLQLAAYILKRSGHVVLVARDGREALAVASAEVPDLILSDLHMAGMGGAQLCQALMADARLVAVPRIALTGHAHIGAAEEMLASGFHGYIAKPIDVGTFVQEVEGFLPADRRGA